ncbi:hypothetical protein CONCODRAFT_77423 [Conidiobolus coronatus NRRL 28638]|uniref:BZIP domain-containing protein n=1 Tax=Conidiobolus coronatus (strain ATCC 28846 / CBS 209.66 / NRRL 28638) TaxID=796925 RepID=A0A137PE44_CONC2|nr:hypothetical protein CONCODRAFT_77423 [Conidiobolus coronatus NRRL 28638]|eukprot:KXN73279.1 hypothetical protein CONCODRAFT_77423 [Conidiobolus coronatus NRRL 28638]
MYNPFESFAMDPFLSQINYNQDMQSFEEDSWTQARFFDIQAEPGFSTANQNLTNFAHQTFAPTSSSVPSLVSTPFPTTPSFTQESHNLPSELSNPKSPGSDDTQNDDKPPTKTRRVIKVEDLSEEQKAELEEDKRKRNTLASARFRLKKKEKEQTLEKTAKEMTEKAEALQTRVNELEKQVKWLTGLLLQKDPETISLPPTS